MERKKILVLLLCNYYLTYRCNAACSFCHFSDSSKFSDSVFASREEFEKNVTELASMGVKFIDLTGGEPLLHKDIALFADYAHQLKMQTSITTNGLLYPKFADKLAGKVNLLHFSIDSPDEEEHNSIRNVNCFKSVIQSIKIARSLGEYPDVLFTVTNKTFMKLPRMHQLAAENNQVLLVNPVFSYFGNEGLSAAALDYIQDYCYSKPDIYLNNAFITLRRDGGNKIENPSCKAVSRSIVISPSNEIILPCYHFGTCAIRVDTSIRTIRRSPEYLSFRKMEGRFDFCEGCTLNCYFEPSFAFPTSKYGLISLASKIKYSYNKLIKQKLHKLLT